VTAGGLGARNCGCHAEADGWQAEGGTEYGFVFVRREGERRLTILTPRDPYDKTVQSFDPFRRK